MYEDRRLEEVIEQVDALLPTAASDGLGDQAAALGRLRALAYFNRTAGDRGRSLDAALEDFDAALDITVDPDNAADLLMHAGLVAGEDVRGDVAENRGHAVHLLRAALERLHVGSPPELARCRGSLVRTRGLLGAVRRHRHMTRRYVLWPQELSKLPGCWTDYRPLGATWREVWRRWPRLWIRWWSQKTRDPSWVQGFRDQIQPSGRPRPTLNKVKRSPDPGAPRRCLLARLSRNLVQTWWRFRTVTWVRRA